MKVNKKWVLENFNIDECRKNVPHKVIVKEVNLKKDMTVSEYLNYIHSILDQYKTGNYEIKCKPYGHDVGFPVYIMENITRSETDIEVINRLIKIHKAINTLKEEGIEVEV